TGLDDLITVGDIWRALPMEQLLRARWWRVPAAEVPRGRDDVVRWLYDLWEHIDAWIEQNPPARGAARWFARAPAFRHGLPVTRRCAGSIERQQRPPSRRWATNRGPTGSLHVFRVLSGVHQLLRRVGDATLTKGCIYPAPLDGGRITRV